MPIALNKHELLGSAGMAVVNGYLNRSQITKQSNGVLSSLDIPANSIAADLAVLGLMAFAPDTVPAQYRDAANGAANAAAAFTTLYLLARSNYGNPDQLRFPLSYNTSNTPALATSTQVIPMYPSVQNYVPVQSNSVSDLADAFSL